jgi:hypothetical protein
MQRIQQRTVLVMIIQQFSTYRRLRHPDLFWLPFTPKMYPH